MYRFAIGHAWRFAVLCLVSLGIARPACAVTLHVDIDERTSAPLLTQPGFQSLLIDNLADNAAQTADTVRTFGPATVRIQNAGSVNYDDRVRGTPSDGGGITTSNILRDFIFSGINATTAPGTNRGLDVYVTGLTPYGIYRGSVWSFDSTSGTVDRVSDWAANGITFRNDYTFIGSTLPATDADARMDFTVMASADGAIAIRGRKDALTPANQPGVFLNAFELEETGLLEVHPGARLSVDFGTGAVMPGFSPLTLATNGAVIDGKTVTIAGFNTTLQERTRTVPADDGIFTHDEILQDFIFASNVVGDLNHGLDVQVDGLRPNHQYLATVWGYDNSSTGARASDWLSDEGPIPYQFAGEALPRNNEDYRFSMLVTADETGRLVVSGRKSAVGLDNHAVFINALQLHAVVPEPSGMALVAAAGVIVALARLRRRFDR